MSKRIDLMTAKNNRRIFVIDIENVLGTGVLTKEMVDLAIRRLTKIHSINEKDLVVFGVSYDHNVFPVQTQAPYARVVYEQGADGADRALTRVLAKERVEDRFTEVVIISGDGFFANEAERLKRAGMSVIVTARKATLSRKLAKNASRVCYMGIKRQTMEQRKAA